MGKQGRRLRRDESAVHAEIRESPFGVEIRTHDCDVVEQIASLAAHRASLEVSIGQAVAHAREEHNVSWADIGQALGVTKQSASARYGRGVAS